MAIKLFSVTWATDTAGPSPDNNMRTELFLKGCKKAIDGNACKGCFNKDLWNGEAEFTYTPEQMATQIIKMAPNKYITIGGGEPTDQIDDLVELTFLLKKAQFHIMVYTWRDLESILKAYHERPYEIPNESFEEKMIRLLSHIDILVDGSYDENERLYNGKQGDGFLSSVGSGNQIIWDTRMHRTPYMPEYNQIEGYKMRDLAGLYINPDKTLTYITKEKKEPIKVKTIITKEEF